MNWGIKIIIGMLTFMSFIGILAVLMLRSKTDALVDQDYYEKGLNYDEDYQLKENVIRDDASPKVSIQGKSILILFKTEATGKIKLMRVSDQRKDKMISFRTNEMKEAELSATALTAGLWKLIVTWQSVNGSSYLMEQEINVP